LGNETTTTLQAVMQLGVDNVRKLLLNSEEAASDNLGLQYLQTRAILAARVALDWSTGRADLNPAELALAALLNDTGELLLWLYAPELAQAALDELHSGRATRTTQAQIQTCGFTFKELTTRCAELWNLPTLLRKLLQGAESERALLTKTCTDFSRHLLNPDTDSDKALAADIVTARKLMPNVSYAWLLSHITLLDEERKQNLIERANNLLTFEI
jgi:HD-like signal output (HDOD) protein